MVKEKAKEKGFETLREVISPENLGVMAELITIKQTKKLIGYIGTNAINAHKGVYRDVMRKNDLSYILSDNYDLVQDVALFLCEHIGEYLDDYLYTSKADKAVTIKMECYYIIKRELYKRYCIQIKNRSLEGYRYFRDRKNGYEDTTEETEESYDRVEKLVELMNLNERQLIVLNGRLNGVTYSQLAAILNCTCPAVHSFRYVMQKRYIKALKYFE